MKVVTESPFMQLLNAAIELRNGVGNAGEAIDKLLAEFLQEYQHKTEYDPCIRTYTGRLINVFDPNPDDIVIEDIAHALSIEPRFASHTKKVITVGQHSLWVASKFNRLNEHHLRLPALMHDATEGYLKDMPKPIKDGLIEYRIVEARLQKVIWQKFNIQVSANHDLIKAVDADALDYEFESYHNTGRGVVYDPIQTEQRFLKAFYEYSK